MKRKKKRWVGEGERYRQTRRERKKRERERERGGGESYLTEREREKMWEGKLDYYSIYYQHSNCEWYLIFCVFSMVRFLHFHFCDNSYQKCYFLGSSCELKKTKIFWLVLSKQIVLYVGRVHSSIWKNLVKLFPINGSIIGPWIFLHLRVIFVCLCNHLYMCMDLILYTPSPNKLQTKYFTFLNLQRPTTQQKRHVDDKPYLSEKVLYQK